MSTLINCYIHNHVLKIVRTLEKDGKAPQTNDQQPVPPNATDMKELENIWLKAYWTALQGTARPTHQSCVLISFAREIADRTVRLFWGGLERIELGREDRGRLSSGTGS